MSAPAQEPPKSGWNWWAFIFGGFWFCYKGMWGKGVALIVLDIIADTLITAAQGNRLLEAALVSAVLLYRMYVGHIGNEQYYIHWRKKQIALGNIQQ